MLDSVNPMDTTADKTEFLPTAREGAVCRSRLLQIQESHYTEYVKSPTLCDPMDCSLPGSSLHGILQARILEWVAISFSSVSSQLRDQTQVSCTAGRRFNLWATREAEKTTPNHKTVITWK